MTEALRAVTSPQIHWNQNCSTGNWQQAIEDAQAALQFDPTIITAWYRYGISLITAKLPGEAIEVLETALTLSPKWYTLLAIVIAHKRACPWQNFLLLSICITLWRSVWPWEHLILTDGPEKEGRKEGSLWLEQLWAFGSFCKSLALRTRGQKQYLTDWVVLQKCWDKNKAEESPAGSARSVRQNGRSDGQRWS